MSFPLFRAHLVIASFWAAHALSVPAPASTAFSFQDPERIEIGRSVDLDLGDSDDFDFPGLARARMLELLPADAGAITIRVGSADADVLVRCVDASGATLVEDDDGGIEWNARLVLQAVAREPIRFVVGFKSAPSGRVRVEVLPGDAPEPVGTALSEASAQFLRARGHARLLRGERQAGAVDLHEAGQTELGIGQYARARADYREVLDLAEELDQALLRTVAQAVLGAIHLQYHELREARTSLEAAIAGARALPHAGIEAYARSKLGDLLALQGEHALARAEYERALELARESRDRGNEIVLCSLMAKAFGMDGAHAAAQEWHTRALDLARLLDQPGPLCEALFEAARFHDELCGFSLARGHLEEALELAPHPQRRAAILGLLGNVALHTGDPLTALELYGRALDDARVLGDKGLEASALLALGQAHEQLGSFEPGRERLEAALILLPSDGPPGERAEALRTLAMVLAQTGESDAARPHLDESLALARKAADVRLQGLVLSSLVGWHYRRGEFDAAMEPARRQLELGRQSGLADLEAMGLANVAELHLRQGDVAQARELSKRTLELCRALGDPRLLQSALLIFVECAQRDGDATAMGLAVAEAEECFQRIDLARLDPDRLSSLRATDVFALWGEYGQESVAAVLDSPDLSAAARQAAIELGFRRAGLWKARGLLQGIAEHRRGGRSAQSIAIRRDRRELLAEREALLARLAAALRDERSSGPVVPELRARLAEMDARSAALEARLRELTPGEQALDQPQGVHPRDLERALGAGDVLVEYANGRHGLYAYVLHRGVLRFLVLGDRAEVDARIARFRDEIAQPARDSTPQRIAVLGRELYATLLEPILALTGPKVDGLVLAPTPALSALPFSALVVDAPAVVHGFDEITFVIDRHALVTAASAPVLALTASARPRTSAGESLILADPQFGPEAQPTRTDLGAWPRLPGTRAESLAVAAALGGAGEAGSFEARLDAVAHAVGSARSGSIQGNGFLLHLGAAATPDCLSGDLRRFSILHCATHGSIDARDPRRSGLILSAGADGDAVLTVSEILELDLDAELVVLSACDTGRGTVLRGEGVQSLARAFQFAGARSVVATLWPVDDQAACSLMSAFYARLADPGVEIAVALREASLAVRRNAVGAAAARGLDTGSAADGPLTSLPPGHPRAWAPFVLSGAPRARGGIRTR